MVGKTATTSDPRQSTSDRIVRAEAKVADLVEELTRRQAQVVAIGAEMADLENNRGEIVRAGRSVADEHAALAGQLADETAAIEAVRADLDVARGDAEVARGVEMEAYAEEMRAGVVRYLAETVDLLQRLRARERCGYLPEVQVWRAERRGGEAFEPISDVARRMADQLAEAGRKRAEAGATASGASLEGRYGRGRWVPDDQQRLVAEGRLDRLPEGINRWVRQSGLTTPTRPTVHPVIGPSTGGPGPYANPKPYAGR